MEVYPVDFDGKMIKAFPHEEQVLFVQVTRFLTEINILTKAAYFASNKITASQGARKTARCVMALFFIRELAEKLTEAWNVVSQSYFGSRLSKEYDARLEGGAKVALGNMKRYFSRCDCPVRKIRNCYAAHYDRPSVEVQLKEMKPEERFTLIMSESMDNSLWLFGEDIAMMAILKLFDADRQTAMDKMFDEVVITVPGWFQEFGGGLLAAILEAAHMELCKENLGDVPCIDSVDLPFFVCRKSGS